MTPVGRFVPLPLPAHELRPLPGTAGHDPWGILDLPVRGVEGGQEPLLTRLAETDTDAFVVVHAGRIALQWYRDDTVRGTPQSIMSITKSVVGTLAGVLDAAGALEIDRLAVDYVPELGRGGYARVSVRDLLDMRTGGSDYTEDYTDQCAELAGIARAVDGTAGATPLRDLVADADRHGLHAGPFCYRSLDTDALGWVLERAAATPIDRLLGDLLAATGVAGPVHVAVDESGVAQCSGGLATTALDIARYGLMMLHGGAVGARQVVPTAFVQDLRRGGADSADVFRARVEQLLADRAALDTAGLRTGHYRSQFWVPRTGGRALISLGIHGQWLHVDPDTDCVVVKLSSWRNPQDPGRFSQALECDRVASARLADAPRNEARQTPQRSIL